MKKHLTIFTLVFFAVTIGIIYAVVNSIGLSYSVSIAVITALSIIAVVSTAYVQYKIS